MKAAELRIGNWIQSSSNKEYQINLSWYECCKDSTEGRDIQLDTFPIPLTEEWLIKFGFDRIIEDDKGNEYCNILYSLNGIDIWFYDEWKYFDLKQSIKSVHQLQNLYLALTGEELTIK